VGNQNVCIFVFLENQSIPKMKKAAVLLFACLTATCVLAGSVKKTFTFSNFTIEQNGSYQTLRFDNTMPAGLAGEPALPYRSVALMLPPGEKAADIVITRDQLVTIPGNFVLYPQQEMQPLENDPGVHFLKKESVYRSDAEYPSVPTGNLLNSYLNGFAFAMTTFTPVVYNPAHGTLSYYRQVTVTIRTRPALEASLAMKNLTASENALKRVRQFAQNPEMIAQYPAVKASATGYKVLIITPSQFQSGFQDLVNYYNSQGKTTQIATIESISSLSGQDLPEKMRNYIISQYQANGIEHVILGGDVEFVPYRGFYCYAVSGSGYEDYNIPADIYFSSLDGSWNTNGNEKWGEPGEDDLLPEISVGRMSFSTADELAHMVHKSVSYQGNPVLEVMKRPFLVSEFLYDPPLTYGSDYLELLVDNHSDNGYFTHGIPSAQNTITRLYDSQGYNWSVGQLLTEINNGHNFIHHSGHANSNYMMRLSNWDITNENFASINGVTHNYMLMYTHGCICGAFDDNDCISELCCSIDNFLVGGVFNSRYGWFDQGTTEGPSAHLHREFISALYHPNSDSSMAELGSAHTMSKIMTAPWVGLPGEFEPGAQRWCHYDCNVLGDPALKIWIDNPGVSVGETKSIPAFTLSPNPAATVVTVTLSGSDKALTLSLLTPEGKTIVTRHLPPSTSSRSINLTVSDLPQGLYPVRIESSDGIQVKKLVVVR